MKNSVTQQKPNAYIILNVQTRTLKQPLMSNFNYRLRPALIFPPKCYNEKTLIFMHPRSEKLIRGSTINAPRIRDEFLFPDETGLDNTDAQENITAEASK